MNVYSILLHNIYIMIQNIISYHVFWYTDIPIQLYTDSIAEEELIILNILAI